MGRGWCIGIVLRIGVGFLCGTEFVLDEGVRDEIELARVGHMKVIVQSG